MPPPSCPGPREASRGPPAGGRTDPLVPRRRGDAGVLGVRSGQLGGRDRFDPVLEEEAGQDLAPPFLPIAGPGDPVGVLGGSDLEGPVVVVGDQRPALVRGEGAVHLLELAVLQLDDPAGLVAVQHEFAVPAL